MNCERVQRKLSAFQDRSLGPEASSVIAEHLVRCRECASYSEELGELRSRLRELPRFVPPARL
ncbi:MAG: anti-sigma factor, partial [Acidobacteria bacterium]